MGRAPLYSLTIKGFGWQSFSVIIQFSSSLITGIILSRLLTPEDFGIVGYAMVFIGFSRILAEAGIAPSLIFLPEIDKKLLGAALTLCVIIGLSVYAILWILTSVIFQGEEEIILRTLSLTFIINSLTIVSDALLQRKMSFKGLFIAKSISYGLGFGLVSIVLAFHDYGVWSMVAGSLVQSCLYGVLLYLQAPFKVSMRFGKKEIQSLLNFGSGMTFARLANFGAGNFDYFIVGQYMGAETLGLYQKSFQLITTPLMSMAGIITSVLFPTLSRVKNYHYQMEKIYLLAVKLSALVFAPLAIFLALSSSEIILVLYGDQWMGSIKSFSILSFNAIFITIFTLGDVVARANGLVYHQFRRHLTYAGLVFLSSILASRYSIEAVSLGVTFSSFLMYLMMAQLVLKIINIRWQEFIKVQLPGFFISLVLMITLSFCNNYLYQWFDSNIFILAGKSLIAGGVFIMIIALMPQTWLGDLPELFSRYFGNKLSWLRFCHHQRDV